MKESKLTEAVGNLDARYIAEAESASPLRRRPGRVLLIAALIAVAVCAVGFTAATRFYFAPGVGIVDDATLEPPQVWAAFDEINLGDTKVDAVVMGEGEDGYNLTVWVWREKAVEQDPLQSLTGIAPKELTDFALFVDGVEYPSLSASMSPSGFSSYSFGGLPLTDTVTLRDSKGNTADVPLKPISESRYAHLKGIAWDDMALSLVPVSGSTNLFAGRLTDPRTAAIAEDATGTSVHSRFRLTHADGTTGNASGMVELTGLKSKFTNCIKVGKASYDNPITAISPSFFWINHTFEIHLPDAAHMPRVTVTVPALGEGYDCSEILYEKAGMTIRLTRVERSLDGLKYRVAVDDADRLPMKNIEAEVYLTYSIGEATYIYDNGTVEQHDAWPRWVQVDTTTGELRYLTRRNGSDDTYETVKVGDKLTVILNSLGYQYLPDGVDTIDFTLPELDASFGTIELN